MSKVAAYENHIASLKEQIRLAEVSRRLRNNADFKDLIFKEFCVNQCARYAQVSGDASLTDAQRQDALNMAQAAGHLRRFMDLTEQFASTAQSTMQEAYDGLEEARQEEGGE